MGGVVARTAGASRGGTMMGANVGEGLALTAAVGGAGLGLALAAGVETSATQKSPAKVDLTRWLKTRVPVRKTPRTVRRAGYARSAPTLRCAGRAIPAVRFQHPWPATLGHSYPR